MTSLASQVRLALRTGSSPATMRKPWAEVKAAHLIAPPAPELNEQNHSDIMPQSIRTVHPSRVKAPAGDGPPQTRFGVGGGILLALLAAVTWYLTGGPEE